METYVTMTNCYSADNNEFISSINTLCSCTNMTRWKATACLHLPGVDLIG